MGLGIAIINRGLYGLLWRLFQYWMVALLRCIVGGIVWNLLLERDFATFAGSFLFLGRFWGDRVVCTECLCTL